MRRKFVKRTSLKEYAYTEIKKGIFDGVFKRGKIFSAQYFADYLEISRTPVREAILQLKDEFFVDILPNRGIIIKEIDAKRIFEISQVRSAIDAFCAAYMAENIHSFKGIQLLNDLKQLCKEQENFLKNITNDDLANDLAWYNMDAKFHQSIVMFTENHTMFSIIANIDSYIRHMGLVTAHIKGRKEDSVEENYAILNAIESGDINAAYQAAKYHVDQIYFKMMLKGDTIKDNLEMNGK
jgi:DNA-binding GntR family transcriptional regulator